MDRKGSIGSFGASSKTKIAIYIGLTEQKTISTLQRTFIQ
jgi:hypothetical protein